LQKAAADAASDRTSNGATRSADAVFLHSDGERMPPEDAGDDLNDQIR
jgi:hypothetical protein